MKLHANTVRSAIRTRCTFLGFAPGSLRRWVSVALVLATALISGPFASPAHATLYPATNTLTIKPGTSDIEDKTIGVPRQPPVIEIELAIDTTSSMGSALAVARAQALHLVNTVQSSYPGARFAVVEFKDVTDSPVYAVRQSMTTSAAAIASAINPLSASGGYDYPEAYNRVFHDSYTPTVGGPIGWLAGSRKFVVVLGDAEPHRAGTVTPPLPGCLDTIPDAFDTRVELNGMRSAAAKRTLFMLNASSGTASLACYQSIAAGAYPGGAGVNLGTAIAPQILSLINAATATVSSVTLSVASASPLPAAASWVTFTPGSWGLVTPPVNLSSVVKVTVPPGTKPGTYTFDIVAMADGADIGHQTLTIVVPVAPGTLKVCKVAGPGVAVGTNYSFGGFGSTVVVPAGPAPAGYCKVVGSFPVGSNVLVDEYLPSRTSVAISVAPSSRLVGTPDLVKGSATVTVGTGVTEVTFTNRRTGFVEICKETVKPVVGGTFDFAAGGQTYTIPVGVCTAPIELPLGSNTITETFKPGSVLAACSAVPNPLVSCNLSSRTATVNVVTGGASAQQIVTFTNIKATTPGTSGSAGSPAPASASAPAAAAPPTASKVACNSGPGVIGKAMSCSVEVKPATAGSVAAPSGMVTCTDGPAAHKLGTATLDGIGRANVKLTPRSVGTFPIWCTYEGSSAFAASTGETTATVVAGS